MRGEYIERGFFRNFDWVLFGMTLGLALFGVVAIYSANLQSDSPYLHGVWLRQLAWLGGSLLVGGLVLLIDYRFIERFAYPLFFLGVGALVLVDISGRVIGGSQRWLALGGVNLQPSELIKILVIILVARMLDDMDKDGDLGIRNLLKPGIMILIPFALVAKQPDLGTALIYFIIFAGIAFFNGIHKVTLIRIGSVAALLAPLSWLFLKPYQKRRILTLLNPEDDPMGRGYHLIQSKIAVGSGGFLGKGLFAGTQSKLNFLPEKHTDFIFSVVAEEIGFVGSLLLIILMFFFLMRILDTALNAKDKFGSLMVVGVVTLFAFHMMYNIGMTLGLLPITGVPLPFISYGGSSLVTNFIAVGLVLNVSMRRFQLE